MQDIRMNAIALILYKNNIQHIAKLLIRMMILILR